jgi:RNA polymerase sigma factor (sigma-70 family)
MAGDGVVGFVRRLADPDGYAGATDRELLGRFATGRDEAAFAALVARHGRLVRSAAARVLADPADVDDATQATFLVLLRRAEREDWQAGLGPWLYGVAHRVAVKLRANTRRRPLPLGDADPPRVAPPPDPSWREACDLLHEELDRLPDAYRLPLLLCHLEGQTRDEAAATLGLTAGAVKGRVRRGCELLRRRLARRGVSLSVGLLAATAAPCSAGACPLAVAPAVPGEQTSPRVAELAREVTRRMVPATNRLVAAGLVAVVGLIAAAGLVAGTGQEPPRRPAPAAGRAAPSEFLVQNPGLLFLDADGKEKEKLDPPATNGALSPDGRQIAALEHDAAARRSSLVIRTRGEKSEPVVVPLVFGQPGRSGCLPVWSADGRRVLIGEEGVGEGGVRGYAYRVYDLAAKTLTEVKLPDGCNVTGWSADGQRLLADVRPTPSTARVAWLNADGTGKPEFVSPEGELGYGGRLSPDGRRMLYVGGPEPPDGGRAKMRLYALDLATGQRSTVDEPGETRGYCWSPDGSRVAYTWQRSLEKPAEVPERETMLITCDPDGRNRRTVTSRKYELPENSSGRDGVVYFFWVVEWR